MQISYKVHGAARSTTEREVKLGDQTVTAQVPCLVVELVGDAGCHSFTLIPPDLAAAEALFAPDAPIRVTFEAGEA